MERFRGRQTQFYIDLAYGVAFVVGFGYLAVYGMDPRVAAFEAGVVLGYFLRVWEKMVVYERVLEAEVAEEAEEAVVEEVEEQVPDEAADQVATELQEQVESEVTAEVAEQVEEQVPTEVSQALETEIDAAVDQVRFREIVQHAREGTPAGSRRSFQLVESLLVGREVVQDDQSPLRADLVDGLDDATDGGIALFAGGPAGGALTVAAIAGQSLALGAGIATL